ncbi:hypothetical protein LINGRAHAP2_LOCUS36456 [Linum grandiflorum]
MDELQRGQIWVVVLLCGRVACNYRWAITRLELRCSPCCDPNRLFSRYEAASTTSTPRPPTCYFGASIQRALTPKLGSVTIPHISGGELSCGLPCQPRTWSPTWNTFCQCVRPCDRPFGGPSVTN